VELSPRDSAAPQIQSALKPLRQSIKARAIEVKKKNFSLDAL
jgi:hypothetical protein